MFDPEAGIGRAPCGSSSYGVGSASTVISRASLSTGSLMVLAGTAVRRLSFLVRDYIARGHRTEARIAAREESLHEADVKPQDQQG